MWPFKKPKHVCEWEWIGTFYWREWKWGWKAACWKCGNVDTNHGFYETRPNTPPTDFKFCQGCGEERFPVMRCACDWEVREGDLSPFRSKRP